MPPTPPPLNVLWLTMEDTSPRLGCYGDPLAHTPNIDALAAGGRMFTHAFSDAPVCAPSRCGVITGVHAASIGAHHMRSRQRRMTHDGEVAVYEPVPPAYVRCFSEYLRLAGYYCSNNSKTDYQFIAPFTAWDDCSDRAHWRNRAQGAPFFAVFNIGVTHESGMWAGRESKTDPATVTLPPFLPDTPKCREALARHYDNLTTSDQRTGELLRQLDEDGLADNTLVILWADHGEGLPRAKRWVYDAGTRVPMIVRWPGRVKPGERTDRLACPIDLAPTVMKAIGLRPPGHFHGFDLLADDGPKRQFVVSNRDRFDDFYDHVRAVRTSRFRYVRNYRPDLPRWQWNHYLDTHPLQQELIRLTREQCLPDECAWFGETRRAVEELYDCEADPHQLRNLADAPEHQATLAEHRAMLKAWQHEIGDGGGEPEAQLAERMWPGGVQPVTEAPYFVVYGENDFCKRPIGGAALRTWQVAGPALVLIHPPTQGTSIAYRPRGAEAWSLYNTPIRLERGVHHLETMGVRIGYRQSAVRELTLEVT